MHLVIEGAWCHVNARHASEATQKAVVPATQRLIQLGTL